MFYLFFLINEFSKRNLVDYLVGHSESIRQFQMVLSLIAAPMGAIIGNIFSSVALIMVNKRIIVTDEFEFMTVLSGFHFYTSFLSCCFFLLVGFFRYKAPSSYIVVARIAFVSKHL